MLSVLSVLSVEGPPGIPYKPKRLVGEDAKKVPLGRKQHCHRVTDPLLYMV